MRLISALAIIGILACAPREPMTIRLYWAPAAPPDSVSDDLAEDLRSRIVNALAHETISIDTLRYMDNGLFGHCDKGISERSPTMVFAGLGYDQNGSVLLIVWAMRCGYQGELFRADIPTPTRDLPSTVDSVSRSLARTLRAKN